MNRRVYLVMPPNIMRRVREMIVARFPDTELDAPDIHAEMFAFATNFGKGQVPALTVSSYPQILLHTKTLAKEGRLVPPSASLPPLREELVKIGLSQPDSVSRIVTLVPAVLAASASLAHKLEDWPDLCADDFPGPIGCPPADTPLPYLAETVLRSMVGDRVKNFLKKRDLSSNPIDINKRIAVGELTASMLIPAFARTFRSGTGRMVWPKSGALAIPITASIAADADPVAHEILAFLLSNEFQGGVIADGAICPVIPDVPGFEELEENHWNLFWPGWESLLTVAEHMCSINITP